MSHDGAKVAGASFAGAGSTSNPKHCSLSCPKENSCASSSSLDLTSTTCSVVGEDMGCAIAFATYLAAGGGVG